MKKIIFSLILMAGMASCTCCKTRDDDCVCEPNCKAVEEHCGCETTCVCRD